MTHRGPRAHRAIQTTVEDVTTVVVVVNEVIAVIAVIAVIEDLASVATVALEGVARPTRLRRPSRRRSKLNSPVRSVTSVPVVRRSALTMVVDIAVHGPVAVNS